MVTKRGQMARKKEAAAEVCPANADDPVAVAIAGLLPPVHDDGFVGAADELAGSSRGSRPGQKKKKSGQCPAVLEGSSCGSASSRRSAEATGTAKKRKAAPKLAAKKRKAAPKKAAKASAKAPAKAAEHEPDVDADDVADAEALEAYQEMASRHQRRAVKLKAAAEDSDELSDTDAAGSLTFRVLDKRGQGMDGWPLVSPFQSGRYRIGRKATNDMALQLPGISSPHALLTVRGSGVFVTDLGSINGTGIVSAGTDSFVKLPPHEARAVVHGDEIRFGRIACASVALDALRMPSWDDAEVEAGDDSMDVPIDVLGVAKPDLETHLDASDDGAFPSTAPVVEGGTFPGAEDAGGYDPSQALLGIPGDEPLLDAFDEGTQAAAVPTLPAFIE